MFDLNETLVRTSYGLAGAIVGALLAPGTQPIWPGVPADSQTYILWAAGVGFVIGVLGGRAAARELLWEWVWGWE